MSNIEISMREMIYGNTYLCLSGAILIIIGFLLVSRYIDSFICNNSIYRRGILYLGRNTLVVMIFNSVLIPFMNSFFTKGGIVNSPVVAIVRPISVIAVCYIISKLKLPIRKMGLVP